MDNTPKKTAKPRLQLIISVLVTTSLILAELYVMINQPANIVLMIGIAVLVLIAVYFVLDAVMDCVKEKDIVTREQYDNIYRSEKASYMLLRKNLEEISHMIQDLNASEPTVNVDEIVDAQKALAKITVSKNREVSEKLMARIVKIEKMVEGGLSVSASNPQADEKQDRLFIELNNLEASLNDRLQGLSDKLSGFQEEIERLADHIAKINTEAITTALDSVKIVEPVREIVLEEDIPAVELTDDIVFAELDGISIIHESELEDVILEDTLEDVLDPDLTDFDISDEEDSFVESEEDILSQLLEAEEASQEEEFDALAELAKVVDEEPVEEIAEEPEIVVEPEPVVAPTPVAAPADNGGKMGQDDIAALIASMTGGDVAPAEPAPVEEPKPEPTPAPAAPADNGGKMNQDDIAALIASMTGN